MSREPGTRGVHSTDSPAMISLHRRFQSTAKALECCSVKQAKLRNKVFLTIWSLVPKLPPTTSRLTLITKFDV